MNNEIKHIQKVEISNLFGRFDFEWTLQPDVNVLAGANGSGKSTILKLLVGMLHSSIKTPPFFQIEQAKISFTDNKSILFQHTKGDIKIDVAPEATEQVHYELYSSHVVMLSEKELGKEDRGGINRLINTTREALNQSLQIDFINTFEYALESEQAIEKASRYPHFTQLDWSIFDLQNRYLSYQLNLSRRKNSIIENSDSPKEELSKLKQPHRRFFEMLDVMMAETGKRVNREDDQISFLLEDSTPIYPHQLSSGEKQLLIILLTILVQDNKQAILFLDEPEISLHIEWQKKLIEYMTELNPNLQIILATHSPAIIMEGWFDHTFNMHELIKPKK